MKKTFILNLIVIFAMIGFLAISSAIAQSANPDKDKAAGIAQAIKDAQNQAVVTKVSSFNGTVTVKSGDKTIELASGEAVETLRGVMEKKPISWADVAAYESVIANQEPMDPRRFQFTRWVLENIQTRRINKVLEGLKAKLKQQYLEMHGGKLPLEDILSSYLPGDTPDKRKELLGKVVDQVVEQLGLEPTGPLTHDGWQTKMTTGSDTLHYVDVNVLYEQAGVKLTQFQQQAQEANNAIIKDPELPEGSQHN